MASENDNYERMFTYNDAGYLKIDGGDFQLEVIHNRHPPFVNIAFGTMITNSKGYNWKSLKQPILDNLIDALIYTRSQLKE